MKEDNDSAVDTEKEIRDIKIELKNSKKTRDTSFNDWKEITETEESRRATLNMTVDVDYAVTASNASPTSSTLTNQISSAGRKNLPQQISLVKMMSQRR